MDASTRTLSSDVSAVWRLSAEAAAAQQGIDLSWGLTGEQVAARTQAFGPNEIAEARRRGPGRIFLDQFLDFMIFVLIVAAIVAGFIGDITDAIVIIAIVVLNAVLGFVQEFRAERALAALKTLAAPSARVIRDGAVVTVPASALVPGDVVLLQAGNVIPADLRLIEAMRLTLEEAALTGESQPVEKVTESLPEEELPLGDRRNLAFKGTLVTQGRGRGLVVATGMDTELGKIATLLAEGGEAKTPLQRRLDRLGRTLALAVIALSAVLFAAGLLRGEPFMLMLLTAISLAVAAIPEALPAVVTIALALGAGRMVKRHVLIRRLPAVETLGSVTYICSDKTGTLTLNRMHVEEVFCDEQLLTGLPPAPGDEPWPTLFRALALSNDAHHADDRIVGDPTEVALHVYAERAGFDKQVLLERMPRIAELPFDPERKCMTTLHRQQDGAIAFTKGAPETVLASCRDRLTHAGRAPFDPDRVQRTMERMAGDGLRVLAFAMRTWPAAPETVTPEALERDLTFVGLVGLLDPPRDEAARAVELCRSAGIIPVMITGDHPATARTIAMRLGIADPDDPVMTGIQLARLPLEEIEERVRRVRVYARVAPEQKIKIVQALQDQGEFVAMTGDGVNDAPALRRADIGVAMGINGTDVAKEAAHMILLDDNFASIVSAVREGRRIFDNIRKFLKFVMTGNSGEIWTLFLAPFLGLPIPLLPIHILWVNLVTDGVPGLALAAEPEERGVMRRPPRPPRESLFAHGMWQHILWVGLLIGASCIITQAWALHAGSGHWQTMVFTVLTLAQMGHVLAIRSETESLYRRGLGTNWPLAGAVLLTFGLQMLLIYVPALQPIFKTQALTAGELGFCLAMSSFVFIAVEIEKTMIRRKWIYQPPANRTERYPEV